ncbi:unnamed protein product [Tilletia controversa]|nr:unnamed protein product [Tilletia controversa]
MQIRSSFILFAFPLLLLCSAAVTSAASIRRPGSIGFQDASEPFNRISTQRHQNIREMMKAIKDGGADDPDAQKLFKLLKEDHEVTFQQMMAILHEIDATTLRLRV